MKLGFPVVKKDYSAISSLLIGDFHTPQLIESKEELSNVDHS